MRGGGEGEVEKKKGKEEKKKMKEELWRNPDTEDRREKDKSSQLCMDEERRVTSDLIH